jgi:hypothetical protein
MNVGTKGVEEIPAEAAGIKGESENKWLTLIQNASKNRDRKA